MQVKVLLCPTVASLKVTVGDTELYVAFRLGTLRRLCGGRDLEVSNHS